VARKRREHEDLGPEELRDRLHRRLAEISPEDGDSPADRNVVPDP
jgi:hypothetical protein